MKIEELMKAAADYIEAERAFAKAIDDRADPLVMPYREAIFNAGLAMDRILTPERVLALCEAMMVPDVWSMEERDGMAKAFDRADDKHSHYETLFAVGAWLLRHRMAKVEAAFGEKTCTCLPLPEPPSDDCPLHGETDD